MTDTTLHQDIAAALHAYEASWSTALQGAEAVGTTLTEAAVLLVVANESKSMVQIAAERGVTKQAIQSQVQSLAKRGFVVISPSKSDARLRLVSLTAAGQEIVAAYSNAQTQLDARLEEKLGPQRLKNFRNMLGQVFAGVS